VSTVVVVSEPLAGVPAYREQEDGAMAAMSGLPEWPSPPGWWGGRSVAATPSSIRDLSDPNDPSNDPSSDQEHWCPTRS
jgi:hypothetical protein